MLSKMPWVGAAVIASVPKSQNPLKEKVLYLVFLFFVIALGVLLFPSMNDSRRIVTLKGKNFSVTVADTQTEREQGLSNSKSLAKKEGMLFVFDTSGQYCFWMKDMQYPLDIVWINEDKKVVTRFKDLPPESYPKSFCSAESAKYVLELNAGTVERLKLELGDEVSF